MLFKWDRQNLGVKRLDLMIGPNRPKLPKNRGQCIGHRGKVSCTKCPLIINIPPGN